MTSSTWMPWRTKVLDLCTRSGVTAEEMTAKQLSRMRGSVPMRPPYTWVVGRPDPSVTSESRRIRARDGHELKVRIHRPPVSESSEQLPLLLHFHGGGFVIGNVGAYDPYLTTVAAAARVVVVTVAYRMAPEHRAPLAVHDCQDGAVWALEHALDLGVRADSVGVTGDSAGGNLAAGLAQHLRDAGVAGLRHQALVYPAPDLTERELEHLQELDQHYPILTPDMLRSFRSLYLGDADDRDPILSPAHGDLAGLPPALVQTAELDPLRPDGEAYADALRDAGVETRHTMYRGAPHGFINFPGLTAAGYPALEELVGELRHHLHEEPA
ncbi:alpha/beta hydrolase [Janibacter sp. GS2]|uniref:alpha/beta hydrolase n=1 Tax=Janibacter sp. GS2 TaxID=3442646 RepID=UPI003EBC059D